MRRALLLLLFLASLASAQYQIKPMLGETVEFSNPVTRGLVGYWPANEGTGTLLSDLRGWNVGTLGSGVASPTWVAGPDGPALSYDGGDIVTTTASCSNRGLTCVAYVNLDTLNAGAVLCHNSALPYKSFSWSVHQSGLNYMRVYTGDGTTSGYCQYNYGPQAVTGWRQVVCTIDAVGNVRFYQNGRFLGSGSSQLAYAGTFTPTIGNNVYQSTQGKIAWLALWQRVLLDAEITSIYDDPGQLTRSNSMDWSAILSGDPPASFIPHVGLNGLINWPINGVLQ